MNFSRNYGFTLPELAVALTILGVLAVLVVPRAASFLVQARRGEAKANLEHIKSLQAIYKLEHGTISKGWVVGYDTNTRCNDLATELLNPLGFNPKGCSSLRYSYYVHGSNYYAWAPSNQDGKWIYPDCPGGATPAECDGASSGDKLKTSDSDPITVCRNITKYCPTTADGSNSFPSAIPTITPPPPPPPGTPPPTCTAPKTEGTPPNCQCPAATPHECTPAGGTLGCYACDGNFDSSTCTCTPAPSCDDVTCHTNQAKISPLPASSPFNKSTCCECKTSANVTCANSTVYDSNDKAGDCCSTCPLGKVWNNNRCEDPPRYTCGSPPSSVGSTPPSCPAWKAFTASPSLSATASANDYLTTCCLCSGTEREILQGLTYCCTNRNPPSTCNAPSRWELDGSQKGAVCKCSSVISTPPKCSTLADSLMIGSVMRDRNQDKNNDTYTTPADCYCPETAPKWRGGRCSVVSVKCSALARYASILCEAPTPVYDTSKANMDIPADRNFASFCCKATPLCSAATTKACTGSRDHLTWVADITRGDTEATCCKCNTGAGKILRKSGSNPPDHVCCANQSSTATCATPKVWAISGANDKGATCTCKCPAGKVWDSVSKSCENPPSCSGICTGNLEDKSPQSTPFNKSNCCKCKLADDVNCPSTEPRYDPNDVTGNCCTGTACPEDATRNIDGVTVDKKESVTSYSINSNECYCGKDTPNWNREETACEGTQTFKCNNYNDEYNRLHDTSWGDQEELCVALQNDGYTMNSRYDPDEVIENDATFKSECCRVRTCNEYYVAKREGQGKTAFCADRANGFEYGAIRNGITLNEAGTDSTPLTFSPANEPADNAFRDSCCHSSGGCVGDMRRIRGDTADTCCKTSEFPTGKTSCTNIGTWISAGSLPNVSCTCKPYSCQHPPTKRMSTSYHSCPNTHRLIPNPSSSPVPRTITETEFTSRCCVSETRQCPAAGTCGSGRDNRKHRQGGAWVRVATGSDSECCCPADTPKWYDQDGTRECRTTCKLYNDDGDTRACNAIASEKTAPSDSYRTLYKSAVDSTRIRNNETSFFSSCCAGPESPLHCEAANVDCSQLGMIKGGIGIPEAYRSLAKTSTERRGHCCCPANYSKWDKFEGSDQSHCQVTCAVAGSGSPDGLGKECSDGYIVNTAKDSSYVTETDIDSYNSKCCTNFCSDVSNADAEKSACDGITEASWKSLDDIDNSPRTIADGCCKCNDANKSWSWVRPIASCVCNNSSTLGSLENCNNKDITGASLSGTGATWDSSNCKCICYSGANYEDKDTSDRLACCPTNNTWDSGNQKCVPPSSTCDSLKGTNTCSDYTVHISAMTTTPADATNFGTTCCRVATCQEWRADSRSQDKKCLSDREDDTTKNSAKIDSQSSGLVNPTYNNVCCKAPDMTAPNNCYWGAFVAFYNNVMTTSVSTLSCDTVNNADSKESVRLAWEECRNKRDDRKCLDRNLPPTIKDRVNGGAKTLDEALGLDCGGVPSSDPNCYGHNP